MDIHSQLTSGQLARLIPSIKTEKMLGSNSPKEQAAPMIFSSIFSKTK